MDDIDELVSNFASQEVTPQPNSTARDHPRFAMYKVKSDISQEKRRKKFLDAQKLKRFDYAAHARGLATNQWDYDDDYDEEEYEGEEEYDENEEDNEIDETMDCEEYRKPPRSYKDQLMLSEWLVEVPSDLESQWLFVFCPVGKRCLVVASRSMTKVYTKSGYCLNSFASRIPGGGCPVAGAPMHVYSLLDCIFNEEEKTYYILDVMCWNSHPCFDSETDFRFYWLHSKIAETPEVKEISSNNPYKFLPLPYYSCEKEKMREVLFSPLPFKPKLDGILFYHKKTHYNPGTTPLVGWLKPYMLPEMLNIDIPNEMASEKPINYTTMKEHCPEAFKKNEERKIKDATDMQFEDD